MTKNLYRIIFTAGVIANAYLFGEEVGEFVANGDLDMLILMGFVFVASAGVLIYTWNIDHQTECGLE